MLQDQATKAIYQRWMTLWPGLSSNVPFVFDNDVVDQAPIYARVSIDFLDEEQQTLGVPGNRKFMVPGLINVKLYGLGNVGRGSLDAMADFVRKVYQAVRFGASVSEDGITTYSTSADMIRPESDAQYWVMVCTTAFEFFDVR